MLQNYVHVKEQSKEINEQMNEMKDCLLSMEYLTDWLSVRVI